MGIGAKLPFRTVNDSKAMTQTRLSPSREAAPDLFRLVYRSKLAIVGSPDVVADEIYHILRNARAANRRSGITGALLFDQGTFAQVLEGPPTPVKSLYGHIVFDRRHSDVSLVEWGPIESREFETWSLAYLSQGDDSDVALLDELRLGNTLKQESVVERLATLLKK